MRTRSTLLATMIGVAFLAAACGRATEEEINQALGVTPTPTRSAEEIATGTAVAQAAAATRTAEAAMAGSPGAEVALGDVTRGRTQFTLNCIGCHGPAGQGGNLLEPGGPASSLTYEQLLAVVRQGQNHPTKFETFRISDSSIADVLAYIQAESGA